MFDELEPDLAKIFAQTREPIGGDEFMATVLLNIERATRARMRRLGVISSVAVAALRACG